MEGDREGDRVRGTWREIERGIGLGVHGGR